MEQFDVLHFFKDLPVFAWVILIILSIGILFALVRKLIKVALILAVLAAAAYFIGRYFH